MQTARMCPSGVRRNQRGQNRSEARSSPPRRGRSRAPLSREAAWRCIVHVLCSRSRATTPVRAAQLLYVTTDELGRRTVSVATVLQPLDKAASAASGLDSYQAAYDALGARCDPSYTLRAGRRLRW